MQHCYTHVPYYRELMQSRQLHPDDFQTPCDLAKLPYLTRDIIRAQAARLRADNYPDSVCQFRRSGGTTGEPIQVAADARARAFEIAAYLRGFEWMKYRLGRPCVRLFGGSLGLSEHRNLKTTLREWLLNIRFLPAFALTPDNVGDYIATIQQARGGVVVGYASALLNLAEYMSRRGVQGSPLESVICTAEYMPDEWRTRISEVLDVPVFCYYGCGEVNGIGHECVGEDGYIVSQEHVILEVGGDDPTRFQDQGQGEACITTLFNYAMPLIRYMNGDMLDLQYPQSGRVHLRITKCEGRIVDRLSGDDGRMVSGILVPHIIYKSGFPAWKYQLVQTAWDNVIFHYLPQNDGMGLSQKRRDSLVELLREYLGNDVQVQFVMGQFEMSKSGKHRIVINKAYPQRVPS
jgi:phenylacetate-CoA ligase